MRTLPAVLLTCFCSAAIAAKQPAKISAQDYAEILQLYAEFNTTLDLRMPDRYVKTWTDDGQYQGGRAGDRATPLAERKPDVVGKEALRNMAAGPMSSQRHSVTNVVVTPASGGATATAYLILMNANTSPPTPGETAVYHDTLVKTQDGWKFKKRINYRDDDPYSPYKGAPPPARQGGGPQPAPRQGGEAPGNAPAR
jgi:SnoaL-like domain